MARAVDTERSLISISRPGLNDEAAPATVSIATGARSQRPRQGDRIQTMSLGSTVTWSPSGACECSGPTVDCSSAISSSAPRHLQPMSSQTWRTRRGRGVVARSA